MQCSLFQKMLPAVWQRPAAAAAVNSRVCYRQTLTTMSRAISYPATSGDSRISNVGGKRRPQYFFPSQHFFRMRSSKMNSRPRGGCKCFFPVMGDPPPTRGNLNCYTKSVRACWRSQKKLCGLKREHPFYLLIDGLWPPSHPLIAVPGSGKLSNLPQTRGLVVINSRVD